MIWAALTPDEKDAAVRQLLEVDKLSFGQAADRLGVSRNSVLSVARRRGIAPANPPGGTLAQLAAARPESRKGTKHQALAVAQRQEPRQDPPPPVDDIWRPLPGTVPILLEYHREGQCRWVVGPMLYCGQPVGQPGAHYCDPHHAAGTRLPERKEP